MASFARKLLSGLAQKSANAYLHGATSKLTEKVQSVAYIEYKGSQLYCNTRMCLRKIRPKTMLFNK